MSDRSNVISVILRSGGALYSGESHDAEEVNAAGPLLLEYTQIEPGRFNGSGSLLVLPHLAAAFGSLNRGMLARGTLLEKHICVYGSVTAGPSFDFNHQRLGANLFALTGPDCEVELFCGKGWHGFQIAVCPEFWDRTAEALHPGGGPVTGVRLIPLRAESWAQLLGRLNWISEAIQTYADSFEEPSIRDSVEQELVQLLISATADVHQHELRALSASTRALAFRRIRHYVHEHLEWPITLADLCRVTDLGARSLQGMFRERLGVSPMQYVRAERLNRAHALLLGNVCAHVSEAARLSGYWHMAQFAADYRKMFQETPSSTLKRGRKNKGISIG